MQAGLKLPAFTKLLFNMSTYFNVHMVPVLTMLFGIPIIGYFYLSKTEIDKKQLNKFIRFEFAVSITFKEAIMFDSSSILPWNCFILFASESLSYLV